MGMDEATRERLRNAEGAVACARCKTLSGITGNWRKGPAAQEQLHRMAWKCVHAGHLPDWRNDPRVWVCPACLPLWRDGLAVRDMERMAGRKKS